MSNHAKGLFGILASEEIQKVIQGALSKTRPQSISENLSAPFGLTSQQQQSLRQNVAQQDYANANIALEQDKIAQAKQESDARIAAENARIQQGDKQLQMQEKSFGLQQKQLENQIKMNDLPDSEKMQKESTNRLAEIAAQGTEARKTVEAEQNTDEAKARLMLIDRQIAAIGAQAAHDKTMEDIARQSAAMGGMAYTDPKTLQDNALKLTTLQGELTKNVSENIYTPEQADDMLVDTIMNMYATGGIDIVTATTNANNIQNAEAREQIVGFLDASTKGPEAKQAYVMKLAQDKIDKEKATAAAIAEQAKTKTLSSFARGVETVRRMQEQVSTDADREAAAAPPPVNNLVSSPWNRTLGTNIK